MTEAQQLAEFVDQASYENISDEAREQLKIRVLDALGCAIGAVDGEPIRMIRKHVYDFSPSGHCTLIGGGTSAPDLAGFYNSALVRYLDYNDSYLAKGETCHPSDNLGAMLAASEYARTSGRDLLLSLAVAYQVQCRLSAVAPVRAKGFDHTTQGSYAVAAGAAKALGLEPSKTTNAIAIAGTAFNALRVTRTGDLSHWKGLAYPNTCFGGLHSAFLAMRGITGPPEVFEGNKGFKDSIAGEFEIDWSAENLEEVTRTIIKKYNAEIHSQSSIEGVLELQTKEGFTGEEIEGIDLEIFDVAYNIIGGGEEGDKLTIRTKEEADHSLLYMVAVAILDGQVLPAQYEPERIRRRDVQSLLKKIRIKPVDELSARFPDEMPCRLTVRLKDGRKFTIEKRDYEGFFTKPMQWKTVAGKFDKLAAPYADDSLRGEIVDAVENLDGIQVSDLMGLLERVNIPGVRSPEPID
jgi:2-methylcitrate dehydratase